MTDRPPADTEIERQYAADAARFRYLLNHGSSAYAMTQEQPAECGISFEWQQSKPAERYWTIRDAIDDAMRRQADYDREATND